MKWAVIISVALFVTSADLREVQRTARDAESRSMICNHVKLLGKEKFKQINVVSIGKYFQESDCAAQIPLADKLVALGEKCCDDPSSDPHCLQDEVEILQDELCAAQDEIAKNQWIATCCNKAGAEKHECFSKEMPSGNPTPFEKVPVEKQCKLYAANPSEFMSKFLCEGARRFPSDPITFKIIMGSTYINILDRCCTNETLQECYQSKKAVWSEKVKYGIAKLKDNCRIINKYGHQILHAKKLAEMSMKFPRVDFQTQVQNTKKIVDMHDTCCKKEPIDCLKKRYNLINSVCSDHKNLAKSKQLTQCCKLPPIQRSLCIDNITPEGRPEELEERLTEYINDKEICKKYKNNKTEFLGRFIYEFARRNGGFAKLMHMRIVESYQDLLEQCCSLEDPVPCYSQAEEMLKRGIAKNKELVETRCQIFEKVGQDASENILLAQYTKKLPTVPFDRLREASKAIAKAAAKCCSKENLQRNACFEDIVSIVVGELCDNIDKINVSPKIAACCNESYARVRPCITEFDHDETFQSPPLDEQKFTLHADLCTLSKADLHNKKAELIYNLVLQKVSINNEQITGSIQAFYATMATCCKSPKPEECFSTEGPKTVAHVKTLLNI